MNSAEKCRANNWGPGTVLVGDDGYGPEWIAITAVGEENILARRIAVADGPTEDAEGLWTLEYREWRVAT